MGGLEIAQAAVLDVRDCAAAQLELEMFGVVRGPEQDCLVAQPESGLAVLENPLAHGIALRSFVGATQ